MRLSAGGTLHRDTHKMGSKYPRSVRYYLPLWALTLETALILIFTFFASYDIPLSDREQFMGTYQGEGSLG